MADLTIRGFELTGTTRTTFLAGLALIVIGSPVNGFLPGFALVAGFRTTLSFSRPGMTNWPGPFLPSSLPISSPSAAKTPAICFLPRPVFSARAARISCLLAGFGLSAFRRSASGTPIENRR
jgi:hypothetical protein